MSSRFTALKDNENIFKRSRPSKKKNNNQNNTTTNQFKHRVKKPIEKEKEAKPQLIITNKSIEFPELTDTTASTRKNSNQISYKGLLKTTANEISHKLIKSGMIILPLSKADAERIRKEKHKQDMEIEFKRHREMNRFLKEYAAREREERIENGEKLYECSEFEEIIEFSDDDDSDDNGYTEDADYETPYYNTR